MSVAREAERAAPRFDKLLERRGDLSRRSDNGYAGTDPYRAGYTLPVTSRTGDKAAGARLKAFREGSRAAGNLATNGFVLGPVPLRQHGRTIRQHCRLRQSRKLLRQLLRTLARLSRGDQAVGEADGVGLAGVDGAAREHHVEGAALADQARQADRAAVGHGPAVAPAEHAEDGRLVGDAADRTRPRARGRRRRRGPGYGGDDRLAASMRRVTPLSSSGPAEAERGRRAPSSLRSAPAQQRAVWAPVSTAALGVWASASKAMKASCRALTVATRAGVARLRAIDRDGRHGAVAFDTTSSPVMS